MNSSTSLPMSISTAKFKLTQRVHVFAERDEHTEIRAVLDHLRFEFRFCSYNENTQEIGASPAGAISIISDRVAAPLELCRTLTSRGPVVLITEDTDFDFRLATARAGVKAIVRRPLDPIQISDWLSHLTRGHDRSPISVVLVDDDEVSAELNAEILRAAEMRVDVVCNPFLALDTIARVLPDLVLMDLRMPGVDGAELAQVIRQSREFVSTPVVFLSAERDESLQTAARRLGGDDFIEKPIRPRKLITEVRLRAERARTLRTMIERDGLTGLVNHGHFHERLNQELARYRRTGDELSIAMIDLDRFKTVNDLYGHPVGDSVLRKLANLLTSCLRQTDIIGRYGGEEFGVIFPDTDMSGAAELLERIRRLFATLEFAAAGETFRVTFSAGVASCGDFGHVKELVGAADRALYRAKTEGRNRIYEASPMRQSSAA